MNVITIGGQPRAAIPDAADLPPLSPPLDYAVARYIEPADWQTSRVVTLPADVRAEAQRALEAHEAACKPVGGAIVREWLRPLNSAVRNPQRPDDFAAAATVIAFAIDDLPRAVFTRQTQRAALCRFKFWPSAADVLELLNETAMPLLKRLNALRAIVAAGQVKPPQPAPEEVRPRTREGIDMVCAKFRRDLQAVGLPIDAPATTAAPPLKPAYAGGAALQALRAAAPVKLRTS